MNAPAFPSEENNFLAPHVGLLRRSFKHWTRRDLLDPRMIDVEAARYLFTAPFVVLSQDTAPDPLFNYGNRTGLSLFGMTWEEMMACPSRLSVESTHTEEREELLKIVKEKGYVEDYRGIRVGRHGRRFEIEGAIVWNLRDNRGMVSGQAALFKRWKWL